MTTTLSGRARSEHYECEACGERVGKWAGRCPVCEAWNSLVARAGRVPSPVAAPAVSFLRGDGGACPIEDVVGTGFEAQPSGIGEFDRVLGVGVVPGSVTLVGGEPGIGKSTLLLQVVAGFVAAGWRVLYVAAEESAVQVRARAERLGAVRPGLWLLSETNLETVLAETDRLRPDLVVIDSIQVMHTADRSSPPGSVGQVRDCALRLADLAKAQSIAVVLVGHVTKDGALAGPRQLEHLVDTVLAFEGDRYHSLRQLRAMKHRFGATNELGLFEMTETGLLGLPDASGLFLTDRATGEAGSIVFPLIDGKRPLLVEVQALVVSSPLPMPRRMAEGLDASRVAMLLAVLERRAGLLVAKSDVHTLAVGGVQVTEPAADLALVVAIASSVSGTALPATWLACGEVGLAGEVRAVPHLERRLREAERLGFTTALVPASAVSPLAGAGLGLELMPVRSVGEALEAIGKLTPERSAGRRPASVSVGRE